MPRNKSLFELIAIKSDFIKIIGVESAPNYPYKSIHLSLLSIYLIV